jgi:excisionase family DNA binding protein
MLRRSDCDLNGFLDELANRLAERLVDKLEERLRPDSVSRQRLLTVEQAATYLGRSPAAVQHMIASGKLRAVRIDRRVAIDLKDLERLVEAGKIESFLPSGRRLE